MALTGKEPELWPKEERPAQYLHVDPKPLTPEQIEANRRAGAEMRKRTAREDVSRLLALGYSTEQIPKLSLLEPNQILEAIRSFEE